MLAFRVSRLERVGRQDVSLFDQSAPGIAVVLLQDAAPDRLVVYGDYLPEQETPALAGGSTPAAEGTPVVLGPTLALTVTRSAASAGSPRTPLPDDWTYLLVDFTLEATGRVDTGDLSLELIDAGGVRYAPVSVDDTLLSDQPLPSATLAPGDEVRASVAFLVPRAVASPLLHAQLGDAQADVALDAAPAETLTASSLDVVILDAQTEGTPAHPGDLVVTARLFNPHAQPITVLASEVAAVFSPAAPGDTFPVGPLAQEASGLLPLTVGPGQAQDIALHFAWSGDPGVGLEIGGYRFIVRLR